MVIARFHHFSICHCHGWRHLDRFNFINRRSLTDFREREGFGCYVFVPSILDFLNALTARLAPVLPLASFFSLPHAFPVGFLV